jgi:predicted RNA binding protein YcfA (HicA-like mRNA interferase family)
MKREDFLHLLEQKGVVFFKHGSRHDIFIHKTTGKKVSVPRHKEIKNKFLNLIIAELARKGIN